MCMALVSASQLLLDVCDTIVKLMIDILNLMFH